MGQQRYSFLISAVMMVGLLGAVPSFAVHGGGSDTGTVEGRIVFQVTDAGAIPSDAVIYLVGDGLKQNESSARYNGGPALLDQRDLEFTPHVLPITLGTEVKIRNSDAIMHNVHTVSRANRPFNRAQLANMALSVAFDAPEVITVTCDIHSQMSAYILVLPNPYFAQATKDGNFTIEGVPTGKYELVAWHEKYGTVTSDVEVVAGQATRAVVKFASTS